MTKADFPQCCDCSHFQQELALLRNEQASLRATKKRDKEDMPDRHDKKIGVSKRNRFNLFFNSP